MHQGTARDALSVAGRRSYPKVRAVLYPAQLEFEAQALTASISQHSGKGNCGNRRDGRGVAGVLWYSACEIWAAIYIEMLDQRTVVFGDH